MSNLQKHFLRYEFKFILNDSLRSQVENELKSFMDLDPFVMNFPNRKYLVRSLYFDDPNYSFYYEKVDGLMHREKFRIRTYSDKISDDVPIALELKGRVNNFVFKHRERVDYSPNSSSLIKPDVFIKTISPDNKLLQQFEFDFLYKKIRPIMLIDYSRRAYQSKYDYEFRITFDSDLYGTKTTKLFPSSDEYRRALIHGRTVMEVKFRKHVPGWFHKIMIKYQLNRVSISKYCTGMESTTLVENLNG